MSTLQRYIKSKIVKDLKSKMVFLGGPRQVGKTTFAKDLLRNSSDDNPAYFNWDSIEDRNLLLKGQLPHNDKLIVLVYVSNFS